MRYKVNEIAQQNLGHASLDNSRVASISSRNLVDAVQRVERMTFRDRERLAEEVHDQQPDRFVSVLVLQRYRAILGR